MKSINGNNRYITIGSYNLGKGLFDSENNASYKFREIKDQIKKENADIFCLIETYIHGMGSRIMRTDPINDSDIENHLNIPI